MRAAPRFRPPPRLQGERRHGDAAGRLRRAQRARRHENGVLEDRSRHPQRRVQDQERPHEGRRLLRDVLLVRRAEPARRQPRRNHGVPGGDADGRVPPRRAARREAGDRLRGRGDVEPPGCAFRPRPRARVRRDPPPRGQEARRRLRGVRRRRRGRSLSNSRGLREVPEVHRPRRDVRRGRPVAGLDGEEA